MTSKIRISQQQAEQYVYAEARLLDQRLYEEWLKLFAPDGVYWVPMDEHTDPRLEPSILYDDTDQRAMRVYQLLHTPHYAQVPVSRTVHLMANVTVTDGERADEAFLTCNMACYELREGDHRQLGLGEQRALVGRCDYRLRDIGSGWAIVLKKVVLINRDLPIRNLSFLL